MAKSIDFAVRGDSGSVMYGSVAGDSGGLIAVGTGEDISLNLRKASILKYVHEGNDLLIELADGRVVTLSNFFGAPAGQENHLLLSSDGEIAQVSFADMGDGVLFADYGAPALTSDKWNPDAQLTFLDGEDILAPVTDEDTTGMAAFAPAVLGGLGGVGAAGLAAAGLGGAALLGGGDGGGGNGGGSGPIIPTVNNPDDDSTLTTNTHNPEAVVSGTGEPGSEVSVTIGDQTGTTVIDADGNWEVVFVDDTLPSDGDFSSDVVVTAPDGTVYDLDGPDFLIDMTPPDVAITGGAESTGDVENLLEYADGITLTGSGEPGAAITVEIDSETQSTTVAADGTWEVTFTTDQLPPGTYTSEVTVTATDALGNETVITDQLNVDTDPHPITFDTVAGDDVINLTEQQGGVTVSGQSTPGATLEIEMGGTTHIATVAADGTWQVSFASGEIGTGERSLTFTATTTDAAGNVSTATHDVQLDTIGTVSFSGAPITTDNIVNAAERGVVTLSGTTQPGTTDVTVNFAGQDLPAAVAADGSWSVQVDAGSLSTGAHTATVTAVDAAGNSATATRSVTFDTETSVTIPAGQAGGDDLLNGAEATGGLVLTGSAEPGATVAVTFEGTTRTVTADGSGNWSAGFSALEVPGGTYDSTVTVHATDLAGNTAEASHVIAVDTEVTDLSHTTPTPDSIVADGIVNAAEAAGGLVVTGTVEAGSSVSVQLGTGAPITASVSGTSWSAVIPTSQLPGTEVQGLALNVRATDAHGNTQTQTSHVDFDPVVRDFVPGATVAGDDIVNAQEASDGFVISGTVEPGATVQVTFDNGVTRATTAGADGQWSTSFGEQDLPGGTGTMGYQIVATDTVGNTASADGSFDYDLDAPDAPGIVGFTRDEGALLGLRVDPTDGAVDFQAVNAGGDVSQIQLDGDPAIRSNYTSYDFQDPVPNGSYLVVSETDAAGNEAATLLVVDNNAAVTVDLNRAGLQEFDFSSIDLSFAPEASLTITASQIEALTGPDQTLVVHGDGNDHITALGATDSGQDMMVGGQVHSVYTLGDATLIVDDEITHVTI